MLTDMSPRTHEQQDLLADQQSDADRERSERLMATLDKLNNEHGAGTVRLAHAQRQPDAQVHGEVG